jgi:hypothetical protein
MVACLLPLIPAESQAPEGMAIRQPVFKTVQPLQTAIPLVTPDKSANVYLS